MLRSTFFPYDYPAVPTPFVENTIISPSNYIGILVENQLATYVKIYFWTLFYLIDPSIFMPTPYHLDYWRFTVSLTIG